MFPDKEDFYSVRLLASRQTPKLDGHSCSAVHECLFNIFAANLHVWRPTPPSATRGDAYLHISYKAEEVYVLTARHSYNGRTLFYNRKDVSMLSDSVGSLNCNPMQRGKRWLRDSV